MKVEGGQGRAPDPRKHQAEGPVGGKGYPRSGHSTISWAGHLPWVSPLTCIPGPSRPRAVGAAGEPISWSCSKGPNQIQERSQTHSMRGRAFQLLEGSQERLCQRGHHHTFCRGQRGRPDSMTSLCPLDRCQGSVSGGIMYSEPSLAKLAVCQACQESSKGTLLLIPVCSGCPEFRDLAEPVLHCSSPSPRLQRVVKSYPDTLRACHQPLPTRDVLYSLPETPFPFCGVLTIP